MTKTAKSDHTPTVSALRELAHQLRDLRKAADLTHAQSATRCGYSVSTLQDAAAGRRLPTQAVTLAFATACGGEPERRRGHWIEARRALDAAGPGGATGAVEADAAAGTEAESAAGAARAWTRPAKSPRLTWRSGALRRRSVVVASASGLLLAVAVPGFLWGGALFQGPHHRDFASVVVRNKVAIGADSLVEDSTPAYLSSRAVSHCAARGCKLSGTEMWSGAKLVVSCWTRGEKLTNEDVTSAGIGRNRAGVGSDLWYRARWKDGRSGYLPEVYVVRGDRGGAGLGRCGG